MKLHRLGTGWPPGSTLYPEHPWEQEVLPEIENSVREFIRAHVGSITDLEVLLLLSTHPERTWTAAEVASELRITSDWAQEHLAKFSEDNLLIEQQPKEPSYRYDTRSPALNQILSRLAEVYARQRITVTDLICSIPNERIHTFADAFRPWKAK